MGVTKMSEKEMREFEEKYNEWLDTRYEMLNKFLTVKLDFIRSYLNAYNTAESLMYICGQLEILTTIALIYDLPELQKLCKETAKEIVNILGDIRNDG